MPLASTFLLLGRCPGETHMGINKETCSECSMHHRSVKAKNKKQKCIKQRVKKNQSMSIKWNIIWQLKWNYIITDKQQNNSMSL